MAYDINQVFLIGRLTRDPETRYSANTVICKFAIANNSGKDEKDVSFFDVVTFGKTAEMCQQYLQKGKQVAVVGRLNQSRWEKEGQKRSRVEIVGLTVQFLSGGGGRGDNTPYSPESYETQSSSSMGNTQANQSYENYNDMEDEPPLDEDEDIPF
jgi:single-strand DNA-binding protein